MLLGTYSVVTALHMISTAMLLPIIIHINNTYPDGEFVFHAIAAVGAAITAYDTYQNEGASTAAKSLAVG